MKCSEIIEVLEELSPKQYACEWDNVGLLVGRRDKDVKHIMVALDATMEVVRQACEKGIDMLITHHPMIFSPMKKVTGDSVLGEKVLLLAEHGISYFAMHTNFDTVGGMAELAASQQYLNLSDTRPIIECDLPEQGMGRYGKLPKAMNVDEVAEYIKKCFGLSNVLIHKTDSVSDKLFERIAVMPGSGKSFINKVVEDGYDLYLTGDIGYHEATDARELGLNVIDATHDGIEKIFVKYISDYLKGRFTLKEMEFDDKLYTAFICEI